LLFLDEKKNIQWDILYTISANKFRFILKQNLFLVDKNKYCEYYEHTD
jgi:hypothetical protein